MKISFGAAATGLPVAAVVLSNFQPDIIHRKPAGFVRINQEKQKSLDRF
jgi:hypothetical protein